MCPFFVWDGVGKWEATKFICFKYIFWSDYPFRKLISFFFFSGKEH